MSINEEPKEETKYPTRWHIRRMYPIPDPDREIIHHVFSRYVAKGKQEFKHAKFEIKQEAIEGYKDFPDAQEKFPNL